MRAGSAIVAGSLLIAIGIAASLSAQTPGTGKVQVAPRAPLELNKAVRPNAVHQSIAPTATFLTADECTSLGGAVTSNVFSGALCASKQLCVTKDNKGENHAVCLEVR